MDALFKFVESTCEKYNIDESHGLKHAMGTTAWAEKLMSVYDDISGDEYNMILYAAALHDMCDSKYRNVDEACVEIKTWLLNQGWSETLADSLISIITSMSYTKLKNKQVPGQQIVYPDHGQM
jgi:HD superfamily phosphodiesterase